MTPEERAEALADFMRKYASELQAEIIQECIELCDEIAEGDHAGSYGAVLCRDAIRALRTSEGT